MRAAMSAHQRPVRGRTPYIESYYLQSAQLTEGDLNSTSGGWRATSGGGADRDTADRMMDDDCVDPARPR